MKPSHTHTSRSEGCTLTGALSVTTQVRDAVSIIHGPKGCAHHNFSLFFATRPDGGRAAVPDLVSTSLEESDIVFGGEEALGRTIRSVCDRGVPAVFVLSTCVVATIGDDVEAVCSRDWPVPVIPVPTAGFLGGTFNAGASNALIALADQADPCPPCRCVNIIGEKNLEYEVEENFAEIVRLLDLLGLTAGIRFVHDLSCSDLPRVGAAQLNILRDSSLVPVGDHLRQRFGTPYVPSFPAGLSDTLTFIGSVAGAFGIDPAEALAAEQAFQEALIADFADIGNSRGTFSGMVTDPGSFRAAREAADALHIRVGDDNCGAHSLPVHPVVGTIGIRRMLHRWRRALHA